MNRVANWVVIWAFGSVQASAAFADTPLSTREQVESSGIFNATWVDDQLSSSDKSPRSMCLS